jgi:hypothetical protein
MQYSLSLLAAAFLAGIASAQNPFSFTTLSTVTAGTPFNITWSPSTGTTDTITLLLRQGDPAHLTTIATIACLLPFPYPSLSPLFLRPKLLGRYEVLTGVIKQQASKTPASTSGRPPPPSSKAPATHSKSSTMEIQI